MSIQQHEQGPSLSEQVIEFANGHRARVVRAMPGADASSLLSKLEFPGPQTVLLVIGAADSLKEDLHDGDRQQLRQLLNRGLARAAVERKAAVVDGGTRSGVMEMMGEGVAAHRYETPLVGVAPAELVAVSGEAEGKTPLDPNHTHFVLVEADEWGAETPVLLALVEALADAGDDGQCLPVAAVLAGGRTGKIAEQEALGVVRRGWPLIVLDGSGPLPTRIAHFWRDRQRREARRTRRMWDIWYGMSRRLGFSQRLSEPALAEIVADGDVHVFPLNDSPGELKKLTLKLLPTARDQSLLDVAWRRFSLYDANATRQQLEFRLLRNWPLVLGVLTTVLALTHTYLLGTEATVEGSLLESLLRFVLILLPIATSVLLAIDVRFKSGRKWTLLRGVAEVVKTEIYRFRVLEYLARLKEEQADLSRMMAEARQRLAGQLQAITDGVMNTEVNESALRRYEGPLPPKMYGAAAEDDGFSPLSPDRYVDIRIGDQLKFFRGRTSLLDRQLRSYQVFMILYGASGALLAAAGAELWIPLSTTVVTALASYLGYYQVEETLKQYNQVENNLNNVHSWWLSLTPQEREQAQTIRELVDATESILRTENVAWVQKMQEAILRKRQDGTLPREAESP